MKVYTDLEQSKKLAEILPLESADMSYDWFVIGKEYSSIPQCRKSIDDELPCWSLAALFKLLPKSIEGAELSLIKTFRDDCRIVYHIEDDEDITSEDYTNPIDACYEMIIRLHKQK